MKSFALILLFLSCNLHVIAQEISYPEKSVQRSSFELVIDEIPSRDGEVRIAIFDTEKNYKAKEDPAFVLVLPVSSSTLKWSNSELPYGEYAIAVYHDKNINGELDTNLLGIPKEAYGFSNNARGKFGPASWNDARFEVTSRSSNMRIKIK
ncbi:MAG: DUF2141 domain-containing protein [Balneolaceae bacterium]